MDYMSFYGGGDTADTADETDATAEPDTSAGFS